MPESADIALAQEYARHHSETAFAELVRRQINLSCDANRNRLHAVRQLYNVPL